MDSLLVRVSIFVFLIGHSDGCNTTYTTYFGEIRSPRDTGESTYPHNARCTYTIAGNSLLNRIKITFVSFETERNFDFLIIGSSKFSGNQPNGTNHFFPFNGSLEIQFRSDGSQTRSGFIIRYRLLLCPSESMDCTECSDWCEPDTCNVRYRSCTCKARWQGNLCDECTVGYYGQNCSSRCSSGCSNGCIKDTGRCICKPGLRGATCNSECINGYYGQNCSSRCSSGCSDVCTKDTGRCTCIPGRTGATCDSACLSGTYGYYCTQSCSPGCVEGSCNKEDGRCSCKAGFRGSNCSITCSAGLHGPNCTQQCSDGCRGGRCDRVTGSCECLSGWTGASCSQICLSGFYGVNCSESCSSGCSGTCNREDGRCTCLAGWEGEMCESRCPADRYGVDCESNCSLGCVAVTCQSEDGNCTCQAGWTGPRCEQSCEMGKYGAYCQQDCSTGCEKYTCNSSDGTCRCIAGYQGDQCTVNVKLIGAAAGGSAGFLLLFTSVLVICCWIRRKRLRKDNMANRTDSMGEHELRNVQAPRREAAQSNVYVGIGGESIYSQPIEEGSEMIAYEELKYSTNQGSVTEEPVPHISKDSTKSSGYVNVTIGKKGVEKLTNSNDEECYENVAFAKDEAEEIPYENFTALPR